MSSWISSLQFRLILGFTLVLALALASVGVYVAFAAQRQVEEFDRKVEEARNRRLEHLVARSYLRQRAREEIQSTLEQAGILFDRRILVTDQGGKIIGDSGRRQGTPWNPGPLGLHYLPLKIGDDEMGSIVVAPSDASELIPDPPVSQVTSALNSSLVWTGLAAAAAGIVLISLVSRRILVPVRTLSSAAERLGRGNLSERVSASGPAEIKRLADTFNTMAENLEEADRHRRNLVADVAHELRTPVSNIQIHLEAMEDGLLETDAGIERIRWQSTQLATLIEDLRTLSMAEAGNLQLNLEYCSLGELLSQSVETVLPKAEAKGVFGHL